MTKRRYSSAGEYIYAKCREWGDDPFITELSSAQTFSYYSFWQDIKRAKNYFDKLGIKKRDVIILQMDNTVAAIAVFMASLASGIIPVPVNADLAEKELSAICGQSGARAVFAAKNTLGKFKRVFSAPVFDISGWRSLAAKGFDPGRMDLRNKKAYIMFTSGSTGKPKEIAISHGNMLSEIESMVEGYALGKKDRHLCVLPVYHVSALYRNILIPFDVGAEVVLDGKFNENSFWGLISGKKINFVQVVPSILKALLMREGCFKDGQQDSLKYIGSASAPHPVELVKAFEDRFGVYVLQGYGMTEATCGITLNPLNRDPQKSGSVGRPLSANRIEIRDEHGKRLPSLQTGRVMVSGENISKSCLWKCCIKGGGRTWFDTGDTGYMDDDDFLWLAGRKGDFIKRGAHRISPLEIENAIACAFPGLETAVIGVPHTILGQDIVAFVSGKSEISSREVIKKIKGTIASYKIPSEVLILKEIPKLGVGKMDRKKLTEYYIEKKS